MAQCSWCSCSSHTSTWHGSLAPTLQLPSRLLVARACIRTTCVTPRYTDFWCMPGVMLLLASTTCRRLWLAWSVRKLDNDKHDTDFVSAHM